MERQNILREKTLITKSVEFSAAHYYYIDCWSEEKNIKSFGKCANKSSHGHNYILNVTIAGDIDAKSGMIINLIDLKEILKTDVLSILDHKNLNLDIKYFKENLPTTENLCGYIWQKLYTRLNNKLYKVEIFEDEDLTAYYKGENNMHYITRIYKFSASHRLTNKNLSEEENIEIFGKCNNFNSHGHNFRLEVTLAGELEPLTGMVYDILEMDKTVNDNIINKFDHQNLNEIAELEDYITTGENLTKYIWDTLKNRFDGASLAKIKLYETDRNYFEYFEE